MATLTIVANIKAKADMVDMVKIEFEKLIDITRAEGRCINVPSGPVAILSDFPWV